MRLTVNIIGAGRLGQTIGHLLEKYKLAHIKGICNSSKESTIKAINFIGAGKSYIDITTLPAADITFITTKDNLIPQICQKLNHNLELQPGNIIVHCSGSLTSDALSVFTNKDCYVASIHPMQSFNDPKTSVKKFNGTYCALEGDTNALNILTPLFRSLGAITYEINKSNKTLYHIAGVFASNYLITLAHIGISLLQEAQVPNDLTTKAIIHIMRSTLENVEDSLDPTKALTGPIQRGDHVTIAKHLEALTNDEKKMLYKLLGKATLPLTSHKNHLHSILQDLLSK